MENIAIIHWYWLVNLERELFQLYIWGLKKYLNNSDFGRIVLSWWFTSKDVRKSEAQSMKDVLFDDKLLWQRILEERSFTTFENVKFCAEILDSIENKNITVFCWNTHLPKIVYLSLQYYLHFSKWKTLELIQNKLGDKTLLEFEWDVETEIWGIKFVWFDLWADKKKFWKAIWSGIIETHYDDFPDLHDDFLQKRKKSWGIE